MECPGKNGAMESAVPPGSSAGGYYVRAVDTIPTDQCAWNRNATACTTTCSTHELPGHMGHIAGTSLGKRPQGGNLNLYDE